MLRARVNISARRVTVIGVFLLAPLVAVVGVALACVPTARVIVNPLSGPGGVQVTMTGDGFPAETVDVDIYLDRRSEQNKLKTVPATTSGADKSFSTQITTPSALGAHLLIPVPKNSAGQDIGNTGTNGAGPPAAVYQVTDPTLSVSPASGRPGSVATVTGSQFKSGQVKLHWDSPTGPELASTSATGDNFGFSRQITVPPSAPGNHTIVGVPLGDPSDSGSATFRVNPPAGPPAVQTPADNVGPALASAALSSGNAAKRASRRGVVTLFCGRYEEAGVSGLCSARSARRLKVPGASKSAVLKLAARSFRATPGAPVRVKFRLSKTGMRMLKKAKKVRMRGSVSASDAKGNPSKVPFSFTLKAPK